MRDLVPSQLEVVQPRTLRQQSQRLIAVEQFTGADVVEAEAVLRCVFEERLLDEERCLVLSREVAVLLELAQSERVERRGVRSPPKFTGQGPWPGSRRGRLCIRGNRDR